MRCVEENKEFAGQFYSAPEIYDARLEDQEDFYKSLDALPPIKHYGDAETSQRSRAVKTDPVLWKKIVKKTRRSSRGGRSGSGGKKSSIRSERVQKK